MRQMLSCFLCYCCAMVLRECECHCGHADASVHAARGLHVKVSLSVVKEAGDEHVCPRAIVKRYATVCDLRYMGKVNEKKWAMSMCAPDPLAR